LIAEGHSSREGDGCLDSEAAGAGQLSLVVLLEEPSTVGALSLVKLNAHGTTNLINYREEATLFLL